MHSAACYLGLLLALPGTGHAEPRQFGWRGVWEWTMPKATEADLAAIADAAAKLGFNVLMTDPPRERLALMRDLCHERGLRLYLSTVFAGGDEAWQQVLLPEEAERQKRPFNEGYQQGGEPISPDELFYGSLPCWSRSEVREYFRRTVAEYAVLPVDGLAFDMVGYVNYRRCHCPVCEASLAAYRAEHAELSEARATAAWAEDTLVDFTNDMAAQARRTNLAIGLTAHVYPYFAPDPYYGHRLHLDTVGQTVAEALGGG